MTGSIANSASDLQSLIDKQRWDKVKTFANDHPTVALTVFREIGILEKNSQFHAWPLLLVYASTALSAELTVEAGWALYFAQQLVRGNLCIPPPLAQIALFTHPLWHQPVKGRRITLIRPRVGHLEFLRTAFSNRRFIDSYNQYIGEPDEAAHAVVARAQQAPDQLRQLEWVVETKQQVPIGLVSIADLTFAHGRGELLIGFPASSFSSRFSVEAALLAMAVAFHHLGLIKLISYVYAENKMAQSATRKLEFVQEGLLRSHIITPQENSRSDLFLNGMLRNDFETSTKIKKFWKRLLPENNPYDLYRLILKI